MSQKMNNKVIVLGTGGTIAGTASSVTDNIGYAAAQVGVAQLVQAVPALAKLGCELISEQIAQLDSKDMSFAVWQALAGRVGLCLSQPDVKGVVITHGTDTLEETAYFLHAVLPVALLTSKPVVLTCAMRPATAIAPDGPQNLLDAVAVALTPGAAGVVAVCAGAVHSATDVQKIHTYRLNAFDSGDGGPVGYVEEGAIRLLRNWPAPGMERPHFAIENIASQMHWPRVEIVMSHAGACAGLIDALLSQRLSGYKDPVRGIVVAATGNGTIHRELEAALKRAQADGIRVVRATRCAEGRILSAPGNPLPDSQGLSPVKARIALMLSLI